jgi:hypothetical protein
VFFPKSNVFGAVVRFFDSVFKIELSITCHRSSMNLLHVMLFNSGDPYRYIRTGHYAEILQKEMAAQMTVQHGPFDKVTAKKPPRAIYW